MNNRYTTLIFDMYGVIIEESKGNFIPYTYNHFDESHYEQLIRQFKQEKLFTKAGNGEFGSDEFLSRLGYDNPQFYMKDYIENHLTLDPQFVDFAEKYYKQFDFVLLSNDVSEWSAYITVFHKLDKYFTHKIVSGDVKCRKPDKQIYEIALKQTDKKPQECIFIDNSVSNLITAEELDISAVLFNRDNEEYNGRIVNSFSELDEMLKNIT